MEQDKTKSDDLKRVKVSTKLFLPDMQIEGVAPNADNEHRLTITVPLSKRDYHKLKDAFDQGKLKDLGVLSISAEPLEAAGPEQTSFAKSESQKRVAHKKSDSTPKLP